MSQGIVAMILLIILLEMWNAHRAKHECSYCGGFKTHASHCPYERLENH